MLRKFLESAGHYEILPPDENCIKLIPLFRDNLPLGPPGHKSFPLALDLLFPTLFPGHPLIGRNHRALEACQQTRLVCQVFDELCKPLRERSAEWRPETTVANAARGTSADRGRGEPSADEAGGAIDRLAKSG